MILIGGATGQLGQAAVAQLVKQGAKGQFAVLARDAAKAKSYSDQGIEVRLGDYDRPDILSEAFAGITQFLFISTMSGDRGPQQRAVVDAARAAGIRHVIYTGLAIRDIATLQVEPLMASHFETEDHIRASGMDWTFLRNTIYAEAIAQIAGPDALRAGISLPASTGRVPYALRSEMGEATANLLLQSVHVGKTYNLTGRAAWSYGDIAAALSRLTGHRLSHSDISPARLQDILSNAGMPEFMICLTLGTLGDIAAGQYDLASNDLEALLGRPAASLDDMLLKVFGLSDIPAKA